MEFNVRFLLFFVYLVSDCEFSNQDDYDGDSST